MEPHLIANVTYDNEVRREEEEVNELEYLTPVCIKFWFNSNVFGVDFYQLGKLKTILL